MTLADSYLAASSSRCGSAANMISSRKVAKYQGLPPTYMFIPVAFENLGPPSSEAEEFIGDLGRCISKITGEDRESLYLWQRISVCLQRFNSVFLAHSFTDPSTPSDE